MTCPQCGRTLPAGTDRCEACGVAGIPNMELPTILRGPASAPGTEEEAPTVQFDARTSRPPTSRLESLSEGARLGNRYQIVSVLGMGGMGVVYRARDLTLERDVALKVIRPEMASQKEILDRFRREIALASRITHRNILRIHDLGESDGLSYISMNFVEGETLSDLLRREGALSVEQAVPIMEQMCEALQAAHDAGVVHRDLKPGNILLDQEGNVYVADFGLSRSMKTGETMTQVGMILGTVEYMCPEQARGETPDHRGDLYSLGLILYEMLTGTLPFRSDNALTSMIKRVHEDVPKAQRVRPGVPPWMSAIITRAVQRDPEARYQSASEILRDLRARRASMAWRRFRRPRNLLRTVAMLGALALAGAGIVTGARYLLRQQAAAPVALKTSLAVLPFRNATGDPQYDWVQAGLPDLVRTDLEQVRALRMAGPDRISGVLAALNAGRGGEFRSDEVRRIAGLLGVDHLLTGTLMRAGDRFRMEATVLRTAGGSLEPAQPIRVEGQGEDSLFGMVDELTRRLRDELGVAPGWGEEDRGITDLSTRSVEALGKYGEALELLRTGQRLDAARRLEAALESDPEFAVARALLAETYDRLGYAEKAVEQADQAANSLKDAGTFEAARVRAVRARLRRDLAEAERAYEALCEMAPNSAEAHLGLGLVQEERGEMEAALASYRTVVELDPKHPEGHLAIGRVQAKRGSPGEAMQPLTTALGLQVEAGNEEGRATVLTAFGNVYFAQGRYDEALQSFQDALAIHQRIGDRRGERVALQNLAVIENSLGNQEEAGSFAEQALGVAQEIGDRAGESEAHSTLGDIHLAGGRPVEALEDYKESLRIVREVGNDTWLAWNLGNIGFIHSFLGNYLESYFFQKQALEKSREMGDQVGVLQALISVGSLEQLQGRYDEALKFYVEGLTLARGMEYKEGIAALLVNQAGLHEDQGDYGASLASLEEAETAARETGDPALLGSCLTTRGTTLRRLGDLDGADEALTEAARIAAEIGKADLALEVGVARAALHLARGRSREAAAAATPAAEAGEGALHHRLRLAARLLRAEARGSAAEAAQVRDAARDASLPPLQVRSSLALARIRSRAGAADDAVGSAEEAIRLAGPMRLRDSLLQGHLVAAAALQRAGRAGAAAEHYVAALEPLEEMRSRLDPGPLGHLLRRPDLLAFSRDGAEALGAAGRAEAAERLRAAVTPPPDG